MGELSALLTEGEIANSQQANPRPTALPNINIPPFCIMNTCACERASGQVSERPKETVLKTVEGQPSASSNLALSANRGLGNMPRPFFLFLEPVFLIAAGVLIYWFVMP